MDKVWQVQVADNLDDVILEQSAQFLQPFLPVGTKAVWSSDFFKWKLSESNPAGPGFITVATHEGSIIGVASITRKRFWDGQKEVSVAEIGDTYSHSDYRRESHAEEPYSTATNADDYLNLSIFGRLVTETLTRAEASGISLIYGTPNGNSMPGYVKRLGFFHYRTHFNRYFIRPCTAGLVQKIPLLKLARRVIWLFERGHSKLILHMATRKGKLKALESDKTLPEIDILWERLKSGQRFGTLRDAAYFRHRFVDNPLVKYKIWTVWEQGTVCGVFVTCTKINPDGLITQYLADWLLDPKVDGLFRFVLAHWVDENSDAKTKSFSFWGESNWIASQKIIKLGFFGKNSIPIIFFDNADSRNLAKSDPVLDFTLATSDNI